MDLAKIIQISAIDYLLQTNNINMFSKLSGIPNNFDKYILAEFNKKNALILAQ